MGEQYKVGDVAQLVTGGTVVEGSSPHMSNVLNLSFGSKEVRTITDLQRKEIATRVGEVLSITGLERLDVYKVILTDFGVDKLAELSRDSYHEVMALLDGWVREAKGLPPPRATAPSLISALIGAPSPNNAPQPPADSSSCHGIARHLVGLYLLGAFGVAGAIIGGMLLLGLGQPQGPALCHFDGNLYSVGSVVKMGGRERECQRTTEDGPEWAGLSESN